jgi:formylglycine-generating enzyme required for sulfatase activity
LLESLKLRAARLGISTTNQVEEQARIEAEVRARKDAEEKARKEKEAQDKKSVEEWKQKQAEDKARQEREVRERKAVGKAKKTVGKSLSIKVVEQPEKKPTHKVNFRLLVIGGIGLLSLFAIFFGGKYLMQNGPARTVSGYTNTPPPKPTNTPPSNPTIDSIWVQSIDGMMMVYIPAGEFFMGSTDADITQAMQRCSGSTCNFNDEQPQHTVYLDAFWMDQTEVTNKMYALCVTAGKCNPPITSASYTHQDYYGNPRFDYYPVIFVSWNDASAYCAWAGRHLPTEAEWEKAARGTDGRTYPWGNTLPNLSLLNFNYNSIVGDTTAVGNYPNGVSPYGAYDMAGNVSEWVNDWYSATYYASSPDSNPTGPSSGDGRVLRGGSWSYLASSVRSALRNWISPTGSSDFIGFRCARGTSP